MKILTKTITQMKFLAAFLFLFASSHAHLSGQDQKLVPFESVWKYLDDGSNQGVAWRANAFDDSSWASGQGRLGFGSGNENTIISFGGDPENKHITTYFRHHFTIDDLNIYKNFLLKIQKDDGAIVYVNGVDVMRSNFGKNIYDYLDEAYSVISSEEEEIIWEEFISPSYFQEGENVIAVEVHQATVTSSDLIFDLELTGLDENASLYREPYLQKATVDGITIKWKTDAPSNSRVWFGSSVDDLSNIELVDELTTNHEVRISGLESDTKYFYKIGNSEQEFIGGTSDFFFKTNPNIGTPKDTRIWITGDAGTGKDEQFKVRDSYLNFAGESGKSDLWLMMGDNAYEHGRESDYHMGLFMVYQEILKNTVSFPTTGNHDLLAEASAITETGAFYDIFALPKDGECGGMPSGSESYYSFDYGNIHFICLESTDLNRDSTGAMATWLKNDLANTEAEWLIAYWHFAPYTKVDHNSDDYNDWDGRAIDMRKNFNPILEQYGVDLVLSGHSHGYERSFLIDGHYGFSNSLSDDMVLDNTSGNLNTTGPYTKPLKLTPHRGTVYLVCGNSGKVGDLEEDGIFPGEHPVMYETNTDFAGSVVIDISGDLLEGKYLNENGIIQDYFHILKENSNSTQEIIASDRFKIYPNPVTDNFKIEFAEGFVFKNGSFQIYSSNGILVKQLLLSRSVGDKSSVGIDINGLAAGVYTVKFEADEKHIASELLIVK